MRLCPTEPFNPCLSHPASLSCFPTVGWRSHFPRENNVAPPGPLRLHPSLLAGRVTQAPRCPRIVAAGAYTRNTLDVEGAVAAIAGTAQSPERRPPSPHCSGLRPFLPPGPVIPTTLHSPRVQNFVPGVQQSRGRGPFCLATCRRGPELPSASRSWMHRVCVVGGGLHVKVCLPERRSPSNNPFHLLFFSRNVLPCMQMLQISFVPNNPAFPPNRLFGRSFTSKHLFFPSVSSRSFPGFVNMSDIWGSFKGFALQLPPFSDSN